MVILWEDSVTFKSNIYTVNKSDDFTLYLGETFKNPCFFIYWEKLQYEGYVLGCHFKSENRGLGYYKITPYVKTVNEINQFFTFQGSFYVDTTKQPYLRKISISGGMYPSGAITILPYKLNIVVKLKNTNKVIYTENNVNIQNNKNMNVWVWEYLVPPEYYGQPLVINANSDNEDASDAFILSLFVDKDEKGSQYVDVAENSELKVLVVER